MRVKVLYFAGARDLAARVSESIDIQDGSSVNDLSSELLKLHPGLKKLARSLRYSVNLQVTGQEALLRDSDVVGVLPPVAGG